MENAQLKIEKLRDQDNWCQWRFIISTLLEEDEDILSVCNGDFERPLENAENYEINLKRFLKADRTARKLIVTTIENKPLDLLISCTTAREMWVKLNAVYDLKSDENLTLVQKKFFDFKWNSSENVAHNISRLEQLASKMKALGTPIPSSILITRILSTLPRKFSHFHSAWDSVDESKKTLENLIARIMTKELRFKEIQYNEENESVALSVKFKK